MNRTDITSQVARSTGLPVHQVKAVIEGFLTTIGDVLNEGDTADIRGFGKFEIRYRKPVKRKNPRTSDPMEIPGRLTATFLPSSTLKSRLNG